MRIKLTVFLLLLLVVTLSNAFSQEFNNIRLTENELNLTIERAYSTGATNGFAGIRPFSELDLVNAYVAAPDDYTYNYIRKDLLDIGLSKEGSSSPSFYLEPLSEVTFRVYTFSTDVPNKKSYCLENMEGNCLDKGLNAFLNVVGGGRLSRNVTFFYEGQIQAGKEDTDAILKKAYIKLKTGSLSWELGKDSIWLGHGYHGSLLLSSNAEPFLLFKVTTEEPFRLPFFLKRLGEFQYTMFHGWLDNFNMLGQRLAWKPFSLLELGVNQTVTYYKDKGIKVWDWPHVFFSSSENIGGQHANKYNNDQRASLDAALYMPFLNKLPYLKGGKIYAEYGGEDIYAWWQKADPTTGGHHAWRGPLGFDFLGEGFILGLFLTSGDTDFRYEYAENYESHPLFFDWYKFVGVDYPSKGEQWYRGIPFSYKGALMGHVMGPEAEDNYFEIKKRAGNFVFTAFYDRQRHHIYNKIDQYHIYPATPEIRQQKGLDVLYAFKRFEIDATVIYNTYKNVNSNPDILASTKAYHILVGQDAKELITGVGIKYLW